MRGAALSLLALLVPALAAAHPPAGHVALRAARTFDGLRWHQGATVVLHGDRVSEVRLDGSVPAGVELIEAPDAVLTPGLVDLDSALGLRAHRDEWSEALSPDLRLLDAFAPSAEEAEALRRSGVTSAWLAPGHSSVLGGRGAVVQPAPPGERPSVLAADWGPTGSLAAAARLPDREPTSLPHQAEMLQAALEHAGPGPARVRFDDAAAASRGARFEEVLLVGLPGDAATLRELRGPRGLVLSALSTADGGPAVSAAAGLVEGGASLGFGSDGAPAGPTAIRWAAARCVQAGLDPEAALSALTGSAAGLARLPGARGTITRGAAADLVLWTNDPIEPASRPLRVWVGGQEVLDARP